MMLTGKAFSTPVRVFAFGLTAVLLVAGCGKDGGDSKVKIQGSGASFPDPLYKRMIAEYNEKNSGVAIDYQAIGSGGGIKAITDKTVYFCGSDAPMKASEIKKVGGEEAIVEIPSCAGGVVMIFNLEGVADLKLTGDVIAKIYLGDIAKWNDSAIATLNPEAKLPDLPIVPAARSDASGTTFIFTNYLSTQSEKFKTTIGSSKQVKWTGGGQRGSGNAGVADIVSTVKGAIGYVEQSYADQKKLPYASVKNQNGKFVKASPETVSKAGAGAAGSMKGEILAANIWNQPGDDAYPIASFTYIIVYKDLNNLPDKAAAQALVDFLWWMTHDGQKYAKKLDYAPLAPEVQAKVEAALKTLNYKGEALTVGAK